MLSHVKTSQIKSCQVNLNRGILTIFRKLSIYGLRKGSREGDTRTRCTGSEERRGATEHPRQDAEASHAEGSLYATPFLPLAVPQHAAILRICF